VQLPSLSGGYHTYRYLLSAAFEKYCLWSPVVCEPRSPLNKKKLSECEQERSNNIISFYSFLLFTVAPRYNEPLIRENSLLRMNSLGFYTPCPHTNCLPAIRNFFQNLAITNEKIRIFGLRYSGVRLYISCILSFILLLSNQPL